MRAVEIERLSFTYSKKTPFEKKALDDITLSIEEGEFVGVIGETGSGKSTLIQHINGLIKVQEGKLSVLGRDASDKHNLKRLRFDAGMVFQYPEYQLFADAVSDDVAFGPKNMKLDKAEIDRRVRRSMQLVGLDYDAFAARSPFELSGGEKRRAAIAGVIAMEPKILILDEPTAGLDPAGRQEILDLIVKLKAEVSPTVILVSHNMDEIARVASRILVLHNGKIIADGTPKAVFSNPDYLDNTGLDLPAAARIANALRARGVAVPRSVVAPSELIEALKALKGGGADV